MTEELDSAITPSRVTPRAKKTTIAISLVFTLLNMIIAPSVMGSRFNSQRWGEFVGTLIGPIVFGLLVVAFFQLFKRFRNNRSRWKIYGWTVAVLLVSNLVQLAQKIATASNL